MKDHATSAASGVEVATGHVSHEGRETGNFEKNHKEL